MWWRACGHRSTEGVLWGEKGGGWEGGGGLWVAPFLPSSPLSSLPLPRGMTMRATRRAAAGMEAHGHEMLRELV